MDGRPISIASTQPGARDWHADMFRECKSRNREIVVATSMELVNPPAGFGAVYYDGKVVETDVGFGSMKSTHCAFVPPVLELSEVGLHDSRGTDGFRGAYAQHPIRRISVVVLHEQNRE